MKPFSTITHVEPSDTKRYKWASHILGYEANRVSDKKRFDREYNQDPKDTPTVKFGLMGRFKRPPLWKLKKNSLLAYLLP